MRTAVAALLLTGVAALAADHLKDPADVARDWEQTIAVARTPIPRLDLRAPLESPRAGLGEVPPPPLFGIQARDVVEPAEPPPRRRWNEKRLDAPNRPRGRPLPAPFQDFSVVPLGGRR